MPVPDILEEVNLILVGEKSCTDGMHRRITPTLVVEATLAIEMLEEFGVCLAAPKVEVADFEVGPDWKEGRSA